MIMVRFNAIYISLTLKKKVCTIELNIYLIENNF